MFLCFLEFKPICFRNVLSNKIPIEMSELQSKSPKEHIEEKQFFLWEKFVFSRLCANFFESFEGFS